MASISAMAISRSNPRTHVLLSSRPFLSSTPIVPPRRLSSVHPKRCHVFPAQQVQAIVMKVDPAVLFIGVSLILTVFSKALAIYSTGKTVGDAVHDLKQLPKRFSKFRLEGNGVFKSLVKVFFDRAENPEDADVTLMNEVKLLNMRLQSLAEFHACRLVKSDSTADSTTDSTVDSTVSEIND